MTFALTQMASSVYQMFRGALILFTALLAIIFLKRKLYRHHYASGILILTGLVLVGLASLLEDTSGRETKPIGVILVIVAQVFAAIQFVVEEKLMKSFSCHPLKMVGWEGIWGASVYIILMVIFSFCRCDGMADVATRHAMCTQTNLGQWWIENPIFALKQFANGGILIFYVLVYICSIAVFNFSGISVTRHLSSPARAVLDSIRTITVWLFFLSLPVPPDLKEHFKWLQLVGFIILLAGSLIFNEIISVPLFGFDQYTEKAIKERENAITQAGLLPSNTERNVSNN